MAWTELVGVYVEFFKAGPAVAPAPDLEKPNSPEITFLSEDLFCADDYAATLPKDIDSIVVDGKLTQEVAGFDFSFMGQQVGPFAECGLVENDVVMIGAVEAFEDDLVELAGIARGLLEAATAKQRRDTDRVAFISVWECDAWSTWTDYGDEYDQSKELIGYLAIRETKDGMIPIRKLDALKAPAEADAEFLTEFNDKIEERT